MRHVAIALILSGCSSVVLTENKAAVAGCKLVRPVGELAHPNAPGGSLAAAERRLGAYAETLKATHVLVTERETRRQRDDDGRVVNMAWVGGFAYRCNAPTE